MNKATILYIVCVFSIAAPAGEAATIYRCKTYSGGYYHSSEICSKTKGIMLDMTEVPDGMPFAEQSKMAEQIFHAKESAHAADDRTNSNNQRCNSIDRELKEIWSRYKDGNYVPVDQVGKDQTQTRELNNIRASLNCHSN